MILTTGFKQFLLLATLFSATFSIAHTGTTQPDHFLVIKSIPNPSEAAATKAIEDFLIIYANPESAHHNPDWKLILTDQYVFLLTIQTDHISLSLLQYDIIFSENSIPKAQGIQSIVSTRKNGNFTSRFVDDAFDYKSLIQELFDDIKSHYKEDKNTTLIILVPPEVCFENSETIDLKIRLMKHAIAPLNTIKLCATCSSRVSYEEYAVYHNLGDVLFSESYDIKKGIIDIEKTTESRPLRVFLGWNRDGFYAAGPHFLLQAEYNASVQVIDIKKSSGRAEEFVYFTPFYTIPQMIEDLRKAAPKDNKCFYRDNQTSRAKSAKACKDLVSLYFSSTNKFYEARTEFDRPIHYGRPPVVKVSTEDIAKGLRVIIENRELLSFIAHQENVDSNTEEYPVKLKEIRDLAKAACEGDFEKSAETKAFDTVEFCLSLEILTYQLSSMIKGETLDLHIKTRQSNDQPTDAGWLLGAVSSKIYTSHSQDETNLALLKYHAFNTTAENHRQDVLRVTSVLLALVGAVILLGYIVKYKQGSAESHTKSK